MVFVLLQNNCLCLGVFLAVIYLRKLTWDFAAEVYVMLVVIWLMALVGRAKHNFTVSAIENHSYFSIAFLEDNVVKTLSALGVTGMNALLCTSGLDGTSRHNAVSYQSSSCVHIHLRIRYQLVFPA